MIVNIIVLPMKLKNVKKVARENYFTLRIKNEIILGQQQQKRVLKIGRNENDMQ